MSNVFGSTSSSSSAHYDANYRNFQSQLYADMRREAFGEDVGQTGWMDSQEQDRYLRWLQLAPGKSLLDVACGTGGLAMRIATLTGCSVTGIDAHQDAIAAATSVAPQRGLAGRAQFQLADASARLPFPNANFDAITCIDAINHLPDRPAVMAGWARLLKPGGRLLFTNPTTITGPLTGQELRVRSSIGFFLFVPAGYDESVITQCGLRLLLKEDVTGNMAEIAERRGKAREARSSALREIEGDTTYEAQQDFFTVASRIARERRLSRFLYVSER